MQFTLSVSLLHLLLPFIGQLCFVFLDIFGELNFRVCFFQSTSTLELRVYSDAYWGMGWLYWSQIYHWFFLYIFWEILLFLGRVKSRLLSLNHLQKFNIVPWLLLLLKLFGCVVYLPIWVLFSQLPLRCIVTMLVLFRLLTTLFFISAWNILR